MEYGLRKVKLGVLTGNRGSITPVFGGNAIPLVFVEIQKFLYRYSLACPCARGRGLRQGAGVAKFLVGVLLLLFPGHDYVYTF